MRSVLPVLLLAACVHHHPRVPPVQMPPFLDYCATAHCESPSPLQLATTRATAIPMKVGVLGYVGEYGKWSNVSAGYRMRLVERQRGEVQSVTLVANEGLKDGEYKEFVAPLRFAPGDYDVEIEGADRRMLLFEARVAKVRTLGAQSRLALYLHRGTRVWLDEGVLTVARFRAVEAPYDPVLIEWFHDGKLALRTKARRGNQLASLDDPDATPWAFGERYALPAHLADKPGLWLARIHAGREAVELQFEIAHGTLADRDRRTQLDGRYTVASPELELRSIPANPDVVVALDLERPGFQSPAEDPYVKRYAAPLTATPAMIRALTRDVSLRRVLTEFNQSRSERPLVGKVCSTCTHTQQQRLDNETGMTVLSRNRAAEQRAPQLRAQALRLIDLHGGPFTAAETPR